MWSKLDADERAAWKKWEEWDAKRFERDENYFKKVQRRKNRLSGVVDEPGSALPEKEAEGKVHDTVTSVSSKSDIKGKRALEEHNYLASAAIDVGKASFHVPKRRKGDM